MSVSVHLVNKNLICADVVHSVKHTVPTWLRTNTQLPPTSGLPDQTNSFQPNNNFTNNISPNHNFARNPCKTIRYVIENLKVINIQGFRIPPNIYQSSTNFIPAHHYFSPPNAIKSSPSGRKTAQSGNTRFQLVWY